MDCKKKKKKKKKYDSIENKPVQIADTANG